MRPTTHRDLSPAAARTVASPLWMRTSSATRHAKAVATCRTRNVASRKTTNSHPMPEEGAASRAARQLPQGLTNRGGEGRDREGNFAQDRERASEAGRKGGQQ